VTRRARGKELVLRRDLPGYAAHAEKIRFRWIQNVW
jgi:hypothetical protein